MNPSSSSACSWRKMFGKRPPREIASPLIAFSFLGMIYSLVSENFRETNLCAELQLLVQTAIPNHGSKGFLGVPTRSLIHLSPAILNFCLFSKCINSTSSSLLLHPLLKMLFFLDPVFIRSQPKGTSLERLPFAFQSNTAMQLCSVPFSYLTFSFLPDSLLLFKLINLLSFLHQNCRFSEVLMRPIHCFIPNTSKNAYFNMLKAHYIFVNGREGGKKIKK